MHKDATIRHVLPPCLLGVLLAAAAPAPGQSLPAAQPTAQPATAQPLQQMGNAREAPSHARIEYSAGVLTIAAQNASLNEILNEISQKTGMTITGGVTDERVFGNYGPDGVAPVLSRLLDGTGSNMLLLETAADRPRELILTPRNGGPTPPNPNAAIYRRADLERAHPANSGAAADVPQQRSAAAPPAPASNSAGTPQGSSAAADPRQSPNGVKTPQQIYEELMELQKNAAPPVTH